jgi:hypothetical protein
MLGSFARIGEVNTAGAAVLAAARVGILPGVPVGGFHEARFRRELVENTDHRKIDDSLRMTVNCATGLAGVECIARYQRIARRSYISF